MPMVLPVPPVCQGGGVATHSLAGRQEPLGGAVTIG